LEPAQRDGKTAARGGSLAHDVSNLLVVHGPIEMVEGFWQVPTAPGLGIEVDMKECARHPFEPEAPHTVNAVLDDGTIADW
jgi:L-alanine-DL-glutamate epimerase-like enolase superfamily enzyme